MREETAGEKRRLEHRKGGEGKTEGRDEKEEEKRREEKRGDGEERREDMIREVEERKVRYNYWSVTHILQTREGGRGGKKKRKVEGSEGVRYETRKYTKTKK